MMKIVENWPGDGPKEAVENGRIGNRRTIRKENLLLRVLQQPRG